MDYAFKVAIAFWVLCFLAIATTRFGNPYKWSEDGLPRLRRMMAMVSLLLLLLLCGTVTQAYACFFDL